MCLMRVERSACFGLFWHFFDSFGSMFCCFVFFDLIICPCPFFLVFVSSVQRPVCMSVCLRLSSRCCFCCWTVVGYGS